VTAVLLREARKPRPDPNPDQREYEAAVNRIFRRVDDLDREAARRVLARIAELRADIVDRVSEIPTVDLDGVETWQATSLRAFRSELDRMTEQFTRRYAAELADDIRTAGTDTAREHQEALTRLALRSGVPRMVISFGPFGLVRDQIEAAVLYSADLAQKLQPTIVERVTREIQAVVFGGQTRPAAVRNIRDALATAPGGRNRKIGGLTMRALSIERTELIRVLNLSNQWAIRNAEEELPGIRKEWVAYPGAEARCAALNGKRVAPMEAFPGGVTAPPLHSSCRCRVVAWMPGWGG
jgi:hypothetical protein